MRDVRSGRGEPIVPWPFPGDSALDKARHIARDYRNELHRIAPEHCERMDEQARRLGQGWVAPELVAFDLNDWVTVRQAADYLSVSESTIRKWIRPPNQEPPKLAVIVGADGVQRVRVGQLVEIQRDQRERRARRYAGDRDSTRGL